MISAIDIVILLWKPHHSTGPGGAASFRGILSDFGFVRSDPEVLSIDPLAEAQEQLSGRRGRPPPRGALKEEKERPSFTDIPEQFLLLVTCRDEKQQVEPLQRFQDKGIQAKAASPSPPGESRP
jgi:hypothetical protein